MKKERKGTQNRKMRRVKKVEAKDQGLKIKIEDYPCEREVNRGQKGKEEVKATKDDEHSKVHEVSHPSEPERMLKECTEAASEELFKITK